MLQHQQQQTKSNEKNGPQGNGNDQKNGKSGFNRTSFIPACILGNVLWQFWGYIQECVQAGFARVLSLQFIEGLLWEDVRTTEKTSACLEHQSSDSWARGFSTPASLQPSI